MEKSFLLALLFLCGFVIVKAQGPGASTTADEAGNFFPHQLQHDYQYGTVH